MKNIKLLNEYFTNYFSNRYKQDIFSKAYVIKEEEIANKRDKNEILNFIFGVYFFIDGSRNRKVIDCLLFCVPKAIYKKYKPSGTGTITIGWTIDIDELISHKENINLLYAISKNFYSRFDEYFKDCAYDFYVNRGLYIKSK